MNRFDLFLIWLVYGVSFFRFDRGGFHAAAGEIWVWRAAVGWYSRGLHGSTLFAWWSGTLARTYRNWRTIHAKFTTQIDSWQFKAAAIVNERSSVCTICVHHSCTEVVYRSSTELHPAYQNLHVLWQLLILRTRTAEQLINYTQTLLYSDGDGKRKYRFYWWQYEHHCWRDESDGKKTIFLKNVIL